jgi:hypothetical protein
MDIASFIATVTDRNLRREIFMNMDEATLNTLPPALMAEARQVRDYLAQDRQRMRELQERARQHIDHIDHHIPDRGLFGGHRNRREREELERQAAAMNRQEMTLEEMVNLRLR